MKVDLEHQKSQNKLLKEQLLKMEQEEEELLALYLELR